MRGAPQEVFGRQLRKARLRVGWSQEDLAEACGLHRTYVGSVERGERNISLTNIVLLSRALSTTPRSLLRGIE